MSVPGAPSSSLTPAALWKASYFCSTWKGIVIKFLCRQEVAYHSCFLLCPLMILHLTCYKFPVFYFYFPPLNVIFKFWRTVFFLYSLLSSVILIRRVTPSTKWNSAFVVAVHLECFHLVIQVACCFPVIPVRAFLEVLPAFQLFPFTATLVFMQFFFKDYGFHFCGLFLFCRAAEELPSFVHLKTGCFSDTSF